MSKNYRAIMISSLLIVSSVYTFAQNYKPGTIRVKFKEPYGLSVATAYATKQQIGLAQVDKLNEEVGVTSIKRVFRESGKYEKAHRQYGLHLWYELIFNEALDLKTVINKYKKLSYFDFVEPYQSHYIIEPVSNEVKKPITSALLEPTNDPLYSNQWHYQNTGQTGGTPGADISLPQAWSIQTGSPQVIVAVIDGGIDVLHPDLAASMWVNANEIAGNNIDDDHNGYIDDVYGYGFGDGTGTIFPHYHGTHVAGTIAAVTNNGIGVSGIAGGSGTGNGVRLMSCAGFGAWGTGGFEDAMVYAADNGAVISQNSWGGGSNAIEAAIDYFIARAGYDNTDENFSKNIQVGPMAGGIVIFAAGNSNSTFGYPASYPPVMAVAATDHNDKRAWFSTYGSWVDISAPGLDVYSTYPSNSYALLSGTSMACPHVSGVASLIISQFGGSSFHPNQVWDRLQFTADHIDNLNPGYEGLLGTGRVNAFQSLEQADDIPPNAINDLICLQPLLTKAILQWTAPGSSGSTGAASHYDIRYSTSAINNENFSEATQVLGAPKPLVGGSVQQFEVKDLSHSTTYYFAIKSKDFFGNVSEISNVLTTSTLEPPEIKVSPGTLTEDLFTGGKSTQNLTVHNLGKSDLYMSVRSSVTIADIANANILKGTFSLKNKLIVQSPQSSEYRDRSVLQKNVLKAPSNSLTTPIVNSSGKLFFLDYWTSSIIEVDAQTGEVIHTISAPEGISSGPDGLAYDGKYLYFINAWSSNAIYRLNPVSGEVISKMLLPGIGEIDALGASGKYVYALYYGSSQILEIDYDAGEIIRTITPGVGMIGGLSFGGSRGTLFVSNFGSAIYEIDPKTSEVLHTYTPSGTIYGMGYSEGLGVLFVANVSNGSIDAIDPDNGSIKFSLSGLWSSALASDEAGANWLSVDQSVTTVAAGSSVLLPVKFDATGLNGGTYTGEINIKSNDPIASQVTVPVTLNVTGAPDLYVGTDNINFHERYVNLSADTIVKIENKGTDVLDVTGLSIDNSVFSLSPSTPFTLSPGQSRLLTITFQPTEVATYSGQLQINSNDPDAGVFFISLNGKGVTAPVISVTPSSLSASLFSNETTTKTLSIHNTGGSVLKWNISLSANAQPESLNTDNYFKSSEITSEGKNNSGQTVSSNITGGPFPLAPGDFTSKSSSPVPLTCITVDGNGIIYGQANNEYMFYKYNPSTNVWSSLASSPIHSGNNGGATYLNGKIYTVYTSNNSNIGVYDIATNTWSTRSYGLSWGTGNITTDGTYLYIAGGMEFKRYAPESNTWTTLASPPFYFQSWGGLGHYNSMIYGHEGNGFTGFAKYNISTNAWTTLTSVPGGAVLGATIANGKYYTYGSYSGNNWYSYSIQTSEWNVSTIPLFSINDGGIAFVQNFPSNAIYFVQGENGTGFGKYEITNSSNWLKADQLSGQTPAETTTNISVVLDATNLIGGTYHGIISANHNDPLRSTIQIPVNLSVVGVADLKVSPASIDYGDVFVGIKKDSAILLVNQGTENLNVSSITCTNPNFIFTFSPLTLSPGQSKALAISFRPSTVGVINGTFTIVSSDYDQPTMQFPVSGKGVFNPLSINPTSLNVFVRPGQQQSRSVAISNVGSSTFNWNISVGAHGIDDLSEVLESLNSNSDKLSETIPNKFLFEEGSAGVYISDGGNDMYDGGNFLTANGIGDYIEYTNGGIRNDLKFGTGGRYFTAKYPGLFVLAANIDINTFSISGNLGADGFGNVDGTVLTLSQNGKTFKGFIKRVFNAGDPSVNHLIIIEDNGKATHTYSTYTDDDSHQVQNLSGVKRMYYLLFAGNGGYYIDDTNMKGIMTKFLETVKGVDWISISKKTGSLMGGTAENSVVTFNAGSLPLGSYDANIFVTENNNVSTRLSIPVVLTVGLNQSPRISSTIADQTIAINDHPLQLNLANYFTDDDGDALIYGVESTKNIAVTQIQGSVLSLTPTLVDVSTITVWGIDNFGERATTSFKLTVAPVTDAEHGIETANLRNTPNPFAGSTTITYQLNSSGYVHLSVQDVTVGRVLRTLVDKEQPPGTYEVTFNGDNIAAGLYFYRLIVNGQTIGVGKMVKH